MQAGLPFGEQLQYARDKKTTGGRAHAAHQPPQRRRGRLRAAVARHPILSLATDTISARAGTLLLERILRHAVEATAALLVLAEIGILFMGVVARFVLHSPIVWTDELASILFLWLAMLGSVIALQRGQHMRLTAIITSRPALWRARAETLAVGASALFFAMILPHAAEYAQDEWFIETPRSAGRT